MRAFLGFIWQSGWQHSGALWLLIFSHVVSLWLLDGLDKIQLIQKSINRVRAGFDSSIVLGVHGDGCGGVLEMDTFLDH